MKYQLSTLIPISLALLFFGCSKDLSIPEENVGVDLTWKLADGDSIVYNTVMKPINDQDFNISFNNFLDSLDLDKSGDKFFDRFFNSISEVVSQTDFKTVIKESGSFENVLDVAVVGIPKSDGDQEQNWMQAMLTGTVLRGSVNRDGTLHSFWLKSDQKNLVSLLFELPDRPVNQGDTWKLKNTNLLSFDQNFVCTSAEKVNEVTLKEIKSVDGKQVAVLQYNIREAASGDFRTPAVFGKSGGSTKTAMEFIYQARGEFSIDQGKWLSYQGIMSLEASGVMNTSQKQNFALIEDR